jgi:[acyl-carrier-protein] S-malonyltransferase
MTITRESKGFSYVFPGQGSQSVGMGLELYQSSPAAREVFQEADESLGFSLSRLIFEGPSRDLQDTMNSQPAIMIVSIACWKAWEEFLGSQAPTPVSVAGHSLGEYSSLVVAGAISFADGVRLVRERGRLMHEASEVRPGGMAAIIGLDELAFEHICAETGVELANVNSDDQVVISGDKIAVARAMDLAAARGAKKTVPLKVSGAFHSSLMGYAQEGLIEAIADMEMRDPQVPVVANSLAASVTTAEEVRAELVEGLCHCVKWKQSVRYMVDAGASHFMEFGPARVLSSLIKRIDKDVDAFTLSDPTSIEKVTQEI